MKDRGWEKGNSDFVFFGIVVLCRDRAYGALHLAVRRFSMGLFIFLHLVYLLAIKNKSIIDLRARNNILKAPDMCTAGLAPRRCRTRPATDGCFRS